METHPHYKASVGVGFLFCIINQFKSISWKTIYIRLYHRFILSFHITFYKILGVVLSVNEQLKKGEIDSLRCKNQNLRGAKGSCSQCTWKFAPFDLISFSFQSYIPCIFFLSTPSLFLSGLYPSTKFLFSPVLSLTVHGPEVVEMWVKWDSVTAK